MGKVQGEGDYEAARRYRARTKRFMDARGSEAVNPESGVPGADTGVDEKALREVKRHAKAGDQDARDARVIASRVKRASEKSQRPKTSKASKTSKKSKTA